MTTKQKLFLIQEGFKERKNEYGYTDWYKPYQEGIEFVYSNTAIMVHFSRPYWGGFLSVDAIALKLDYYTNKLNDVSML